MIFSYTNKKIVIIAEYKIKIQQEVTRVQCLPTAPNLIWVVNTRPSDGRLYIKDPVTVIPKIGKTTAAKLVTHGITKAGHLSNPSPIATKRLCTNNVRSLYSTTTAAKTCHPGRCPHTIVDYCSMANPYLAKYGEPRWREEIAKSTMLSPFISIKELVSWIHDEAQQMMMGTIHEEDWYFYHNDLSLMTGEETENWMRKRGI